jgi:hypothetical protein
LDRRFPDEGANPRNDGTRTSAIGNDFFENSTQNTRLKIAIREQSQAPVGVIGYGCQRLVDFMGYGRRQFAHSRHPRNAGQLQLHHLQSLLRLFPFMLIHDTAEPSYDSIFLFHRYVVLVFDMTPSCLQSFVLDDFDCVSGEDVGEPQISQGRTMGSSKVR